METIILVKVNTITGLVPNDNIFVKDVITGTIYAGNGTDIPDEVLTTANPTLYANQFLLMGS